VGGAARVSEDQEGDRQADEETDSGRDGRPPPAWRAARRIAAALSVACASGVLVELAGVAELAALAPLAALAELSGLTELGGRRGRFREGVRGLDHRQGRGRDGSHRYRSGR
jgi:hypothetical protein